MQVRFRVNMGTIDCAAIKKEFGVSLKFSECTVGSEHDLPEPVAERLLSRGIVERTRVKGVAKQSDITAPSK